MTELQIIILRNTCLSNASLPAITPLSAKPWKCAHKKNKKKNKSFEMVNILQSIVNAALSCLMKLSRWWAFVHVDIS